MPDEGGDSTGHTGEDSREGRSGDMEGSSVEVEVEVEGRTPRLEDSDSFALRMRRTRSGPRSEL